MIDSAEPPDPFVPTGRELDAGVSGPARDKATNERPGVFERLRERLQRHSGKKHTEIVVEAAPDVMAQEPGVGDREPGEAEDGTAQESTTANSAAENTPSQPPAPGYASQSEYLASVVAVNRRTTPDIRDLCEEFLGGVTLTDTERELLTWWLTADTATPERLSPQTRAHLHGDVLTVLDHVTHDVTGPKRLSSYQHDCATWDKYDQSVKALSRKARDYPSLESLVTCIKDGDIHAAQHRIEYDSAAWHECNLVVSAAMSALAATLRLGMRPPMVRFPRQLAAAPLIEQAVISSVCTPSSIDAFLDASRERLRRHGYP